MKEREEKSGEERCGYMWTIYNVSNAEAVRAQRNGMSDGECGNEGEGEGQVDDEGEGTTQQRKWMKTKRWEI